MSKKAKETEEKFTLKCPRCTDGVINIHHSIYELPDEEKMLILKFECDICNFSKNDIIPIETKMEPGVMTLNIKNEEDLKSKIYRSSTGKLEIPELELVVHPGPSAKFYYTNIEGVLFRFEEAVSIYRNNLEDEDPQIKEIDEVLEDLQKAMKGQLQFTLKITDPIGGSYVIPKDKSKFSFKKIDDKEINNN
jgi:zinc finger protein